MRISDLGELQLAVLHVLWANPSATVHEVVGALPAERASAYTTILSVLRKLEERGLVPHEACAGARMFRYRALVTLADMRLEMVQELLEQLFDGSAMQLVCHLVEAEMFTTGELNKIGGLIKPASTRGKKPATLSASLPPLEPGTRASSL